MAGTSHGESPGGSEHLATVPDLQAKEDRRGIAGVFIISSMIRWIRDNYGWRAKKEVWATLGLGLLFALTAFAILAN